VEPLIAWGLTTLAGSFIGSYLASYLKKKGENRAIREDLDDLLKQVRAVTTTTKEIEAKISTDVWDRQKRWEMKREVLFEATRRLGALEDALGSMNVAYKSERESPQKGDPQWSTFQIDANKKWFDELRRFNEDCLLMGIVCGKDVKDACDNIRSFMVTIAASINKGDGEIYMKSAVEVTKRSLAVTTAIRKELETDK
jgi:hypothetical protein